MNMEVKHNEDFQTSEVRKYAESIYNSIESKLVAAVVDTLGLVKEEDGIDPYLMEFDYAFKKLLDAGYHINHTIEGDEGTCALKINIYKLDNTYTYDVKTNYSISITK